MVRERFFESIDVVVHRKVSSKISLVRLNENVYDFSYECFFKSIGVVVHLTMRLSF